MKRAVFIHDHVFSIDSNGAYYSEGKITDAVLQRYLSCVDRVVVIARAKIRLDSDVGRLSAINLTSVQFLPVAGTKFQSVFSRFLVGNAILFFKQIKQADMVILRLPSFLGLFGFLFALLMRKKYFVELVGHPRDALVAAVGSGFFRSGFARLMSALNRFAVGLASGVIYVTRSALQADYPTRGFSQYASNVELAIEPLDLLESRYEIGSDVPVIGLIGSFNNSYKGIDTAIKAVAHLKSCGKSCRLRVLGSGNRLPYESLAAELGVCDSVFFDGVKSGGKEVYAWLDSLDVYIQPSRTEGLPRSLIEAMSRGLPCVASDAGGMPELLSSDWIFSVNDYVGLSKILMRLFESLELRAGAGRHNHVEAKDYDQSVLAEKRREFWARAASEVFGS